MKDELLMRAAQANGHAYPWVMPSGFGERPWNPLTNNEDAFVLAVRIGLQVTAYPMYDEPKHSVIVRKPVWDHDAQEGDGVEVVEPYGTDALAATRRAITMCAAELARRKTPNANSTAKPAA
jgi:hypothetical protein